MKNRIKELIKVDEQGEVTDVNPIIRLACVNLIRKGKAVETVIVGHETKYIQDPVLVLEEALSILNTANQFGQFAKIKGYCDEEKS